MSIRTHALTHALLTAAPLSLDAFVHTPGLCALERTDAGLVGDTAKLWTLAEAALQPRLDRVSLSTLELLRDRAWFCDPAPRAFAQSVSLADYLGHVANQWVQHRGAEPVLVERGLRDESPHEGVAHWRWISLALPADVLVAAACAASPHEQLPLDDHPQLASRMLLRLLRDDPAFAQAGVAETHVHGNAALSFANLWSNWLRSLDDLANGAREQEVAPFGSWRRLRAMGLSAVLAREAMARFLALPDWARGAGFERWFFGDEESVAVGPRDVHTLPSYEVTTTWQLAFAALCDAAHTHDEGLVDRRFRLWRAVRDAGSLFDPEPIRDGASDGPRFTPRASEETRFTARALRYLRYRPHDALFQRLFWQYLRLRVAVFRSITLEPATPGLDWFNRTDRRSWLFRHHQFDAERIEQGIANASAGVALRAYEPRFVPDDSLGALLTKLRGYVKSALSARRAARSRHEFSAWEFGIVFHFAKSDRSDRPPRDPPSAKALLADPSHFDGLAFGEWIADNTRRAEALCALFEHYPEALLLARGLDVAGRELSMPTWPTTSVLHAARAASCRAAHQARLRWPALELDELRCTFHTGEDYRSLTEGLRRVHEVIDAGVVRRGDRLGHAIALGDPPERWQRAHEPTLTTRVDRLHDLLWELDHYADGSLRAPAGRVERAEEQARHCIQQLFDAPSPGAIDLRAYRRARRHLFSPFVQRQLGYSIARSEHEPPAPDVSQQEWLILRSIVESQRFFERSVEPVTIPFDPAELEMAAAAQRWLRALVTEREITVEANPSSNLLIGDYVAVEDHPVFRLLPLLSRRSETPVLVSLNSDDPVVFATRLGDEYAYVFNALQREGVSAPEALEWLDRVRENALRSRFTLAPSATDDALRWVLDRITVGETDETERLEHQWAAGDRPWRSR